MSVCADRTVTNVFCCDNKADRLSAKKISDVLQRRRLSVVSRVRAY